MNLPLNRDFFAAPGVPGVAGVAGVVGRERVGEGEGAPLATVEVAFESEDDMDGSVGRFLNTRGIFWPSEGLGEGAGRIGAVPVEGEMGEGATMFTGGTDPIELPALGVSASFSSPGEPWGGVTGGELGGEEVRGSVSTLLSS